jgi:hypothetical protein
MQLALSDARKRPFADIMRDDVLLPAGRAKLAEAHTRYPRVERAFAAVSTSSRRAGA